MVLDSQGPIVYVGRWGIYMLRTVMASLSEAVQTMTCTILSYTYGLGTVPSVYPTGYTQRTSIFFTIMVAEWLTMILPTPTPLTYKGEYPHLWVDIKGSSLLYKIWGLDKKRMYRKCQKWSCDKEPGEWVEKRNRGDVWVTFGIATRRVKMLRINGWGLKMW